MESKLKFVKLNDTGDICRVICYDEVSHLFIITPVFGGSSCRWGDSNYEGVKISELSELTDEDYKKIATQHMETYK